MNEIETPAIGSRWRANDSCSSLYLEPGRIYTVESNRKHPSQRMNTVIHTVTFKELPGKLYDTMVLHDMREVRISEKLELI